MADVTAGDDHRPGEGDGDPGDRRRRHGRLGHARRGAGGDRARPRRRAARPFVEARTYRFVGHSRSDPGKYRPEGELEEWQARDPLVLARERLAERARRRRRTSWTAVAADVERELAGVEQAALAAPFPEPEPFPEFKS